MWNESNISIETCITHYNDARVNAGMSKYAAWNYVYQELSDIIVDLLDNNLSIYSMRQLIEKWVELEGELD